MNNTTRRRPSADSVLTAFCISCYNLPQPQQTNINAK